MNFKSTLFPTVKVSTLTLRVRPSRDRAQAEHKKRDDLTFLRKISQLNHRVINWCVSPVSGQLEQHCSFSDSEDPQSRCFSA